jgi:predicted RNase H-like HicB family nuclease
MLTYKAAYKFVEGGVHAQVVDFPEVISSGADLDEARQMLASALIDVAGLRLDRGEPLPVPNPLLTDPDADLDEPIHLHLSASSAVQQVPSGVVVP